MNVSIVMYHYVRDLKGSRYPKIKGLDLADFRKQIEFLTENFTIVRMEDVIDSIEGKKELPQNSLLLTFDDGYIDHYTNVFPVLMEYGIQGSFFIPAKLLEQNILLDVNKIHFILACGKIADIKNDVLDLLNIYRHKGYDIEPNDTLYKSLAIANRFDDRDTIFVKRILQNEISEDIRNEISSILFEKYAGCSEEQFSKELYLNMEQLKVMKTNGMFIGLHGYEHYWMGKLPAEKIEMEVDKALKVMSEVINPKKWVMNYPYGSYSDDVIKIIQEKGACLGLSTEVGVASLDQNFLFHLSRFDTNDFPPKSQNYKMLRRG